jgi:hypothetical protein
MGASEPPQFSQGHSHAGITFDRPKGSGIEPLLKRFMLEKSTSFFRSPTAVFYIIALRLGQVRARGRVSHADQGIRR